MEFFSFHGCFREEQIIGTKFIVDLYIDADTVKSEMTDQLRDTVDYVALYQCVKKEMDQKSHLLEHVAKRILDSLCVNFPSIEAIELKIAKINPPMGGKMHQVAIEIKSRHAPANVFRGLGSSLLNHSPEFIQDWPDLDGQALDVIRDRIHVCVQV